MSDSRTIHPSAPANSSHRPQPEKVRTMFSEIAGQYDLANTVLSGGIHHLWRKALVRMSGATIGDRVLDCATGTGDLAIEFAKVVGPRGKVVGTDFCVEMMGPAPGKAKARGFDIKFSQADVTQLPFADASFDIASISFGIRNVGDPVRGLAELSRVVRPGGCVMVLEFGQPTTPVIREAYEMYSEHVLPRLGGLITGNPQAYRYLQDSSSKFPCGHEFTALMDQSGGFTQHSFKRLTFGVAYLYKGIK